MKLVLQKLDLCKAVYVSTVLLAELYFGAYRSASPEKHLSMIAIAIRNSKLLAIDAETAKMFVSIKLALFAKGKPIPENDIWIAATAIQHNLPLYTSDKHFADIEGVHLV